MIVLDTDVLVDLVTRREPATSQILRLQHGGDVLATTSVNAAEFLRGARGDEAWTKAMDLLLALQEVPFGPASARRFGRMMQQFDRLGKPMSVTDGMIAATTLEAGARLATRNVRDFAKLTGIEIVRLG